MIKYKFKIGSYEIIVNSKDPIRNLDKPKPGDKVRVKNKGDENWENGKRFLIGMSKNGRFITENKSRVWFIESWDICEKL